MKGSVEKSHQRCSLPLPERLRAGRSPLSGAHVLEVRSAPEIGCGLAGWTLLNRPEAAGMLRVCVSIFALGAHYYSNFPEERIKWRDRVLEIMCSAIEAMCKDTVSGDCRASTVCIRIGCCLAKARNPRRTRR